MGLRGRKASVYAIYKGDQFLCIGTKNECAKALDISLNNLESRISKGVHGKIAYENRLIAVRLE